MLRQEFHLTEPARLSMVERGSLVRLTEESVKVCRETVPEARIIHIPWDEHKTCGALLCKLRAHD